MRKSSQVNGRWSGANLESTADHNQRMTLHAIRVHDELTRVELAAMTGLTAPTISNITRRLLDEGLIYESGQRRGGRGQPATRLKVRRQARHAIGMNIDRDHLTLVIVDFLGRIVSRESKKIAFALPEQIRQFYVGNIERLIEEAHIDPSTLVGIGVAVPDDLGFVDLIGRPDAYAQWSDTSIPELLEKPLTLPVFVENDAAAAALGELHFGLGQRFPSFFYLFISSGLGGSLVVDGQLFRGSNGRSGEIGFLPSHTEGSIQQHVSLTGLQIRLNDAALSPDSVFGRVVPTPEAAPIVRGWIHAAGLELRDAVLAINCLINPDAILIGGGLPTRVIDQLAEELTRATTNREFGLPAVCPILRASFSEDAPAVGAAILPLDHFLLPNARGASWIELAGAAAIQLT